MSARLATSQAKALTRGRDRPRRVLMIHCHYRDMGGENISFEAEVRLLSSAGIEVSTYTRDNRELDSAGALRRVGVGLTAVWSVDAYRAVRDAIRRSDPDIVHIQNTFPLISPSAVHAAHRSGVPVVLALRNYRLLCARAILFRDGRICNDCVGRTLPLPAIQHGCYHGSRLKASSVVASQVTHRLLGTWTNAVDLFIAPSEFARKVLLASGVSPDRIVVKPNFVDPDPGMSISRGEFALYAGRLAPEKGIGTMLEAWRHPGLPRLRIAGDGPLRGSVEAFIAQHRLEDRIELLGYQPHAEITGLMRNARFLVFPSEWYETFGRSAAEAFACGIPVVASRLGAMEEIVEDGVSGLLFTAGDPDDLAGAARRLTDDSDFDDMRLAARAAYEERFTASINLAHLMDAYQAALINHHRPGED